GKDIYLCKILPNGEWAKAQNIGGMINTPYDEDGIFIHPDGKTMYFSSKGHSSIGGFDIFSSTMDDAGNWSKPVNMGYPVNTTDDDVFFVTSADGKRGYYSSFQEHGYGEKDIYRLSLEDADAKPVTLLTGYIKIKGTTELPDNAQVLVTYNETGDLVGIYKPRKKDGKFSIILSPGNDYHIVYSAAQFKQEEDLYIPPISAYQEINRGINLDDVIFGDPNQKTTELIGTVKDTEDKIVLNVLVDLYNQDGGKIDSKTTNSEGIFKFTVKQNEKYIAIARKKGYLNSSKSIKKFEILESEEYNIELILEADAGASLVAIVTDKMTNKPLEGVLLNISDKKTGEKNVFITSENGEYILSLSDKKILETVNFNLKLEKKGYITKTPPNYSIKLDQMKRYSINDKLDLAMIPNKSSENTDWNHNERSQLDKLKSVINTLELQIAELKDQLAKSLKDTAPASNSTNDSRVSALEAIIADLKNQIEGMNNTNNVNTNYSPSGNIIASYQEYFNYNVKSVNTSDSKYIDMVNKAIERSKSTGNITIQIESSASHVPTTTYTTNDNLAAKRASNASEKIIASLLKKGIRKENIIISNINSCVGGPKYNNNPGNTSVYEKYQYVIIKIK
ncbi:MAG: PD40 domain-containing protein, partial [Flavobacteriales bacterium]|nr:PD40 domain-containing protein [Flavobacteriales bacterium]